MYDRKVPRRGDFFPPRGSKNLEKNWENVLTENCQENHPCARSGFLRLSVAISPSIRLNCCVSGIFFIVKSPRIYNCNNKKISTCISTELQQLTNGRRLQQQHQQQQHCSNAAVLHKSPGRMSPRAGAPCARTS